MFRKVFPKSILAFSCSFSCEIKVISNTLKLLEQYQGFPQETAKRTW